VSSTIINLIIQVIAGILGGNAAGAAMKSVPALEPSATTR